MRLDVSCMPHFVVNTTPGCHISLPHVTLMWGWWGWGLMCVLCYILSLHVAHVPQFVTTLSSCASFCCKHDVRVPDFVATRNSGSLMSPVCYIWSLQVARVASFSATCSSCQILSLCSRQGRGCTETTRKRKQLNESGKSYGNPKCNVTNAL